MNACHTCQQLILLLLPSMMLLNATLGDEMAFFRDSVEPILRSRCYECHSHAAGTMESGLSLDWRSGWQRGGDRGTAIVPGKPDNSLLIQAVRHAHSELKMPEEKLPAAEIEVLVQWVQQGAQDPRVTQPTSKESLPSDWWSLRPLVKPAMPQVTGTQNPIDAFVRAQLQAQNLSPSPEADRTTLIRRLIYDLHGLVPTPEEVAAFASSDDSEDAWSDLVDQLLESPRYGERWARHWLDTIHFADSHGFEHDVFRPHAWRYRDYVIQSLNSDIPWSRFITEQLAADVLFPESPQLMAALGFLGAGPYDHSAAATAPMSFEYLDRDDLVTQTMQAFVSTTVNCARCHSHKFDPVPQKDYFALQAVFAGIGKGDIRFDADPDTAQQRKRWTELATACEQRNADILLTPENVRLLEEWESSDASRAVWVTLQPDVFVSTAGANLRRLNDDSLLSEGAPPDVETTVITTTADLKTVTALRLDVLTHESLPELGPGRATNGNLHLSEFQLTVFPPDTEVGQAVTIREATADFDQAGWTIQHAIDGDAATAWGIHPQIGKPHHAVFVLESALQIEPGTRLAITLKQVHGRGHIIGRMKLSATEAPPQSAIALPDEIVKLLQLPKVQRDRSQQISLAAAVLQHVAAAKLKQLPEQARVYAAAAAAENERGVVRISEPRTIHLLTRGDLEKPREVVNPGSPSFLADSDLNFELKPGTPEGDRRAALANWLADDRNPLTWRSIANRVWHYHFGKGLCDTPNDFGRMGSQPSHPQLLDWLACELRDHNGSLKHLHRLICNSATWRQSSDRRSGASDQDQDNRWLGRMSRQRMDADSFCDSVLLVSGRLDFTMGGPGVQHFTTTPGPQVTPVLHYDRFDLNQPEAARRSIYRVVWRGIADPLMEALDFPDLGLLAPVRGSSTSPLQALVLLNNRFVLHHAMVMADRARTTSDDPTQQIQQLVQWTWLRTPTQDEQQRFQELAELHGLEAVCRLLLNSSEFLFIE